MSHAATVLEFAMASTPVLAKKHRSATVAPVEALDFSASLASAAAVLATSAEVTPMPSVASDKDDAVPSPDSATDNGPTSEATPVQHAIAAPQESVHETVDRLAATYARPSPAAAASVPASEAVIRKVQASTVVSTLNNLVIGQPPNWIIDAVVVKNFGLQAAGYSGKAPLNISIKDSSSVTVRATFVDPTTAVFGRLLPGAHVRLAMGSVVSAGSLSFGIQDAPFRLQFGLNAVAMYVQLAAF
jgi:hypothetical protein